MTGRLEGRRATGVTAAGQGIGRAIERAFIDEGAEVFASDPRPEFLDDLEVADTAGLDVLWTTAVEDYVRRVGAVDVLANVPGYVHHGTVLDCTEADWDFSFDLNVKSMHRMIRALLPGMLERAEASGKSASIVNLSSGASTLKPAPNRYAYGATKAAVLGLTKADV